MAHAAEIKPTQSGGELGKFERYLSLWVGLCMVAGIGVGKLLPGAIDSLRRLEFGEGSQINIPIAVLIWLMIIPMMMKVDFASIRNVGKRPKGLMVTLFVNWLVKPFLWLLSLGSSSDTFSQSGFHLGKPISTSRVRLSLRQLLALRWSSCGVISLTAIQLTLWCKFRLTT
jgi:hypothetical protein